MKQESDGGHSRAMTVTSKAEIFRMEQDKPKGGTIMGTVEMMSKMQELKEIRAELEALEAQEAALVDELKAEMLSRGVSELKVGTHG